MATRKVRWEEMFPDELKASIEACPACYLAFGFAEPHGPYNAIGLDWIKAYEIVQRAALEHGGVVAPPFAWHVGEMPLFPWTTIRGAPQPYCSSVNPETFLQVLICQLRALDARGFHAGIFITGHYGGHQEDCRLLCDYYRRKTGTPMQTVFFSDGEVMTHENYRGDHAGIIETSQLMYLRGDLVDLSRTVDSSPLGAFIGHRFPNDQGISPSRELGDKIVTAQIARLGEIQKELLAAYRPNPSYKPPTLMEVQDLWHRFDRLTRKYWWWSLTAKQHANKEKIEFPGWEALGE
ncbi:MAG: creatininase family protein [Planctomycetes bacterium]|nr:creatininase family protein [Planctomycetota bacterium]